MIKASRLVVVVLLIFVSISISHFSCSDSTGTDQEPPVPQCSTDVTIRVDAHSPESVVPDWSQPIKVGAAINNLCPQDAIEISSDGQFLYYMHTEGVVDNMSPEKILARYNNTYRAEQIGEPGTFREPEYYDLAKGVTGSLDGELSFTPDGSKVYFHSNRAANTGYKNDPFYDDFLDIYVADIIDSVPGPATNLGPPVNSVYPDGEHCIHPDGVTLYFTSLRPGGQGGADIYRSTLSGGSWSTPVNLGIPINTVANDLQPTFTADGDTMYFTSTRGLIGAAIYRSVKTGDTFSDPELVIRGVVGEPSLTADGELLYFVHVLSDAAGTFDADVYYCTRLTDR